MDIRIEREGTHVYMIPACTVIQQEAYSLRMLAGNQIPGLLSVDLRQMDGQTQVWFDITAGQALEEKFSGHDMGSAEIFRLLSCMEAVCRMMEEYLLNAEYLLWAPECIYCLRDGSFCFACLPVPETERKEDLRRLGDFVLHHLDHRDKQAVLLGYRFYDQVTAPQATAAYAVQETLVQYKAEKAEESAKVAESAEAEQTDAAGRSQTVRSMRQAGSRPEAVKRAAQEKPQDAARDAARIDAGSMHGSGLQIPPEEENDKVFLHEELPEKRGLLRRASQHKKTWIAALPKVLLCMAAAVLSVTGALVLGLDLTQFGGLTSLLLALAWLLAGTRRRRQEKKGQRNRWTDGKAKGKHEGEDAEEAFLRQLMQEVYEEKDPEDR